MNKNFDILEVGKEYKNRWGQIVKIMHKLDDLDHSEYPYSCDYAFSYCPNGQYWSGDNEHVYDLIKLIEDSPIQIEEEPTPQYIGYLFVQYHEDGDFQIKLGGIPIGEKILVLKEAATMEDFDLIARSLKSIDVWPYDQT